MRRFTLDKIRKKFLELLNHKYLVCKYSSFWEYSTLHSEKIKYHIIEKSSYVDVSPVSYINETKRNKEKAYLNERYIACIPNAKIIGNSNVVISQDRTILYDMLYEKEQNFNITDKGLLRFLDSPVHLGNVYIVNYIKKGRKIDKAISLTGNFSKNLYHFMYELLAKSYLLVNKPEYINYPIILSAYVRDIPQFNELCSIFFKNRQLIYVDSEELVDVQELIFPSFCNKIPPNYRNIYKCKTKDVVFDFKSLDYLRDNILGYAQKYKYNSPKKIFISRRSTKWRSYNEDEILEVVQEYGFIVVYPEELTYLQQICLFRDAEYIIAASGAALTNIIACSKGCKMLVFVSSRLDLSVFSTIADFCEVDMMYMEGKITDSIGVQSNFIVNTNKLNTYLENEFYGK